MKLKIVKFWPYYKRLNFGALETENSIAIIIVVGIAVNFPTL